MAFKSGTTVWSSWLQEAVGHRGQGASPCPEPPAPCLQVPFSLTGSCRYFAPASQLALWAWFKPLCLAIAGPYWGQSLAGQCRWVCLPGGIQPHVLGICQPQHRAQPTPRCLPAGTRCAQQGPAALGRARSAPLAVSLQIKAERSQPALGLARSWAGLAVPRWGRGKADGWMPGAPVCSCRMLFMCSALSWRDIRTVLLNCTLWKSLRGGNCTHRPSSESTNPCAGFFLD